MAVDGQWVCLTVEHPLIHAEGSLILHEQQVEVLEGLTKEKGFHFILGLGVSGAAHIANGSVAIVHFAVLLNALAT